MKLLLGKKIGMSRTFAESGEVYPVTLVEVGPCIVTGIRTEEKDGYNAVQVGFDQRKKTEKDSTNPKDYKLVKELRLSGEAPYAKGQTLTITELEAGEVVNVTGQSKGRGFTGVVKRYGFAGAPATHGHKHDLRKPGSIGSAFPQHVIKGKRMAGRSGNARVHVKNVEVVSIDSEKNIVALKGSIPGSRNGYIEIVSSKAPEANDNNNE